MNLVEPHIASLFGYHLPRQLALFLTLGLMVFLFRRDIQEKPNVSGALWLPVLWLVLTCSRGFTQWLNIFGLPVSGAASAEEGSPVDACFYLALGIIGSCILINRQLSLSEIVLKNGWLIAFFLYCFISIAWSDIPFSSFKRWVKVLNHPIMALIVLTEPDLEEALRRLMKRCAYVVVPVSILWIKYYPQLGRGFTDWGVPMNRGITLGKNSLGADCLILGFFFFWHLLQTWRTKRDTRRRNELWLIAGFLIGIAWLLQKAHSATSDICLIVAIVIVVFVGMRPTIKNFIGTYMLTALVLLVAAELAFGISGRLSESLGRGSDLNGRAVLWGYCLKHQDNPILGAGFESYWTGERKERMAALFNNWKPGGAHNGYLDVYLNLGLIGLSLLIAAFIATFWKIRPELFRNFQWGRYRLGYLVGVVLHGWTEGTFTYGPLWFVFYIIALDYPRTYLATAQPPVWVARAEESREFAFAERES